LHQVITVLIDRHARLIENVLDDEARKSVYLKSLTD